MPNGPGLPATGWTAASLLAKVRRVVRSSRWFARACAARSIGWTQSAPARSRRRASVAVNDSGEGPALRRVPLDRHVRSSVYVLPVSDRYDEDHESITVYLVDHSVGTDADAPSWTTGELLTSGGARVLCETTNSVDDTLLACPVDPGESLLSNTQDLDRVAHAS
jgi:hypothetical protein